MPISQTELEAVRRWLQTAIEFVPNPDFAKDGDAKNPRLARAPDSPAAALSPLPQLADGELLQPSQESSLFLLMNRLKYQAEQLQRKLSLKKRCDSLVVRIEALLQRAAEVRNVLIRANLRLVVSVARKFASAQRPLAELVSDGNLTLFRAVEKFDASRGFRFSTYATWAMRYNFARAVVSAKPHIGLGSRDEDSQIEIIDHRRSPAIHQAALKRHRALEQMLASLDDRERVVIRRRYGLDAGIDERSLQELADEMSICKERVRQLQMRVLDKLRDLAKRARLEPPEER
ncbi:MAG: sigma-70 family RNA polymerase sigma factor [Pirellulales bacterium]